MPQPPFPKPGPILETDYVNPTPKDPRGNWPKKIAGGDTFLSLKGPRYEWVSVVDPDSQYDFPLTGLSGTVLQPSTSNTDNPFLHPFGFDFEFFIAPDERYHGLVAPTMEDKEYKDATALANTKFKLNVPGVIGMEIEEGLVPKPYRAEEGYRVCLWGRWIVDAGHGDFHTEIHPPLLMTTAHRTRSTQQLATGQRVGHDATSVRIITRPYLVSQEFGDGGLLAHLASEVFKVQHLASLKMKPILAFSTCRSLVRTS